MRYAEIPGLGVGTSRLGFGLMRLPTDQDGNIDEAGATEMVDRAWALGVNYYDTAYGYLNEQSESFVGRALCSRYPREQFYLADKLPLWKCGDVPEAEEVFREQMRRMRTDYVDFHLLHAVNKERWEKVKAAGIDRWQEEKKREGVFKRIGFSFHDKPEVLEEILSYKNWDFCQIQINYLDYELYESKAMYEICLRHHVPFVVMEPIRGGSLANPHDEVKALFKKVRPDLTPAAIALRWTAALDQTITVLSGMSELSHVEENCRVMSEFSRLTPAEEKMYEDARAVFRKLPLIPCTKCRYCDICPQGIEMWELFPRYNDFISYNRKEPLLKYLRETAPEKLPPACILCHQCEEQCPQHIRITEKIQEVWQLNE